METEETKGLAVPPLASPIIEATPTFPEEIEGLSVPIPASPIIEPTQTSLEETKRLSVPLLASPGIEPISLSQPNPDSLEEPSQQTEKPEAQLVNETASQQFPNPVMKEALKVLIDNTISVVEYGNQVLYRCGYAEVLIVSDDNFISTPSNKTSS